jgi:hypothetical protein
MFIQIIDRFDLRHYDRLWSGLYTESHSLQNLIKKLEEQHYDKGREGGTLVGCMRVIESFILLLWKERSFIEAGLHLAKNS